MKKTIILITLVFSLFTAGCGKQPTDAIKKEVIPFEDGQLYAVAYLGWDDAVKDTLAFYKDLYLEDEDIPVFYTSGNEAYLIIPRYDNTSVKLYQKDFDSPDKLLYESNDCRPFVIRCNASDIFPDSKISLSCDKGSEEFSPCLSLADGRVMIGEKGLDITITD